MSELRNSEAPVSTVTYDRNEIDEPTNNIYEAISVIAKRANQINGDIKKELIEKLEEFATYTDSLEEIFENKEQIEVSKFYEKLPKPHAIAVEEWLKDKVYYRNTEKE
ncbi:DNA-directed RNA polymerase subunit omega [Galbibacter orientalis]|uniref:RNA polymerase Rpb6 n=1 Tax=Galbibacter orientalis DSM 19592 TaxID=926559 RepID=I3C947_9FLAO|nr:DNA-directed RNA polymerase subunit omega [Galbibacter orientalis]EIJ40140.1 RNA polymerase Rpb6 [Galbibacter orientalis DSM 19592]|tara:strand:+ start:404 stop:727 length:324 start_codon:yes stop_codon:yes gene_type:complete